MPLNPATLERLRGILQPKRERYDFAFTMDRWAEIVGREETVKPLDDKLIENEDELIAQLLNLPASAAIPKEEDDTPGTRRGRPRLDQKRWAALLLGEIFYEYTKTKPTRIGKYHDRVRDTERRDKSSPFYQFATVAFRAIGLEPSEDAFREATIRDWPQQTKPKKQRSRKGKPNRRPQPFARRNIQRLLWGGLPKRHRKKPDFTWQEKRLHPRKNLPSNRAP